MERIRDWQSRPDTSPTEGDHVAGGTLVVIRNILKLDRDIILRWLSLCWAPGWWHRPPGRQQQGENAALKMASSHF